MQLFRRGLRLYRTLAPLPEPPTSIIQRVNVFQDLTDRWCFFGVARIKRMLL